MPYAITLSLLAHRAIRDEGSVVYPRPYPQPRSIVEGHDLDLVRSSAVWVLDGLWSFELLRLYLRLLGELREKCRVLLREFLDLLLQPVEVGLLNRGVRHSCDLACADTLDRSG